MRSDWRARPLSPAQERYAWEDVHYLLPLHELLAERLERVGRFNCGRGDEGKQEEAQFHDQGRVVSGWRIRGIRTSAEKPTGWGAQVVPSFSGLAETILHGLREHRHHTHDRAEIAAVRDQPRTLFR